MAKNWSSDEPDQIPADRKVRLDGNAALFFTVGTKIFNFGMSSSGPTHLFVSSCPTNDSHWCMCSSLRLCTCATAPKNLSFSCTPNTKSGALLVDKNSSVTLAGRLSNSRCRGSRSWGQRRRLSRPRVRRWVGGDHLCCPHHLHVVLHQSTLDVLKSRSCVKSGGTLDARTGT